MRLSFAVPLTVVLAALSAQAQTDPVPAASVATIRITVEDCRALVAHQPAADVAFQPGIDVRGRPVVPADLPGAVAVTPPSTFIIPIEIDLVDRLGLLPSAPGFEADALIGTVLYDNGQIFFNGQPLIDPLQTAIAEACRQLIQ